MSTTPKPVMVCVNEHGVPSGRCVYTPQRGWKFFPVTCAHQASRKFWGDVHDCIPAWVQRDSYELMTVEEFNKKSPQFALKTKTPLLLTSPATILEMVSSAHEPRVESPLRVALEDLVVEVTALKLRWPGTTEAENPLWQKLEAAKAALQGTT